MKNYQTIFFAIFFSIFACGCENLFPSAEIDPGFSDKPVITLSGEISKENGQLAVIPQPDSDPPRVEKTSLPDKSEKTVKKVEAEVTLPVAEKQKNLPETKKTAEKSIVESNIPDCPPNDASKKKINSSAPRPENFRRGPILWRAFTRLKPEEQKKMLELQRKEPEVYRKLMQEKANQLYAREKARRQELDELAEKFRNTADPAQRQAVKAELRNKLKEDFMHRLHDTRQDIEAYKLRTAQLEMELQKREKNCDAIIDAILTRKLEEKK